MFHAAGRRSLFAAALFVAAGAGFIASACGGDSRPPAETPAPAEVATAASAVEAPGPSGTIVFSVTGKGYFAVPAGRAGEATATSWTPQPRAGFVTSPDGRFFAMAARNDNGVGLLIGSQAGTTQIARLAAADDPALIEGKGEAATVGGVPLVMAWSPDSRRVAFGTLKLPFTLTVAERSTEGWTTADYSVTGGYVGELRWAPDGGALAISTYALDRKDHTTLLLGNGDSTVRLVVDGCHIVWSPDSRYLAVHRDSSSEPGTWIVSRDGGERRPVSLEVQSFPMEWQR